MNKPEKSIMVLDSIETSKYLFLQGIEHYILCDYILFLKMKFICISIVTKDLRNMCYQETNNVRIHVLLQTLLIEPVLVLPCSA